MEACLHINLLELGAIRLALKAFLPTIKGERVQVLTGNMTTMWYCKKQGDVGSWTLCQEALCLWKWLKPHGISLVAQHQGVGCLNARANKLGERCPADHKW